MSSLFKKPKAAKVQPATGQEKALSRRQDEALSREIEEENRRKKALTRSTLGVQSLLTGLGGAPSGGGGPITGTQFSSASTVGGNARTSGSSLLPTTGGVTLPPGGIKLPTFGGRNR